MFDHRHYVPVLKSKEGEYWALGHLSNRAIALITPVLELVAHKTTPFSSHVGSILSTMNMVWHGMPFFLDVHHINKPPLATALKQAFDSARHRGLEAIPTIKLTDSTAYQSTLAAIVGQDKRGAMIRVRSSEFENLPSLKSGIDALLQRIKLAPSDVHVMLDYTHYDPAATVKRLKENIISLPHVKEWKTLTYSGGDFPASLPEESKSAWHAIRRDDWIPWLQTLSSGAVLPRLPAYSDYGVRNPDAPPSGGRASVNLRYTIDELFMVRKGHQISEGAEQFREFAQEVVAMKCFRPDLSDGDKEILKISTLPVGGSTGGPTEWVQWCMNHHLEFVVEQISKHNET